MTVGFFSPLPPARTGVADYSAALLAELRRRGTVHAGVAQTDVCLYHLGNNQLHREIYERALTHPGVIVLHDAVLQHFMLGCLSRDAYVAEFVYNYGRWSVGIAERLWQNRARSATDPLFFQYPMLKRVIERSTGIIVHNLAAARMVRAHVPDARLKVIPHLYAAAPAAAESEVLRRREAIGALPSTCVVGVFGHLRESKRLTTVLRAVRRLRQEGERVMLLMAGEFASSDLARALTTELRTPGIYRVGYTPESEFRLLAHAVDVCANLRYPAAGETSGIAIQLMGAGKAVMVTDGEETSDFPEPSLMRISPGPAETDMLIDYIRWAVRFPGDARAMGALARRHVLEYHSPDRVAESCWQFLAECRD